MNIRHTELSATYSIAARDPETGQIGVAVETHQMGVGRLVPWLLPGVGAVATQSLVNIRFGPIGLAMLRQGVAAPQIIEALVASDPQSKRRQVAVVDAQGQVGAFTGDGCIAYAAHHIGAGYSVQANMMTNDTVIPAMTSAYESANGDLAHRMLAALRAAQAEDGDIRGMQSAALVVVSGDKNVPEWQTIYDLRVDEHENPVEELARLIRLRHAQIMEEQGYNLLESGRQDEALDWWSKARALAPELEELAFWQAITLADNHHNVATAAAILNPALANDPRREHWINLIGRLIDCGLIDHPEHARELLALL